MTYAVIPRPPYDPHFVEGLANSPLIEMPALSRESLRAWRTFSSPGFSSIAEELDARNLKHREVEIPGPRGPVLLSVIEPRALAQTPRPAMFTIHGGGMVMGDRFSPIGDVDQLKWVQEFDMVLVSPEYRLAPEHPAPAGVEDCLSGLLWLAGAAEELAVDVSRIVLVGGSGGGGIAAGTALMARDRGGPNLIGQLLMCPMLDDRDASASTLQFSLENGGGDGWTREVNRAAWEMILGPGHREREDISVYAAPARARDLGGLPPAYIEVGDAEVFRDEDVAFASRLWAAGVSAELHVWPGGFHGFSVVASPVPIVEGARRDREAWVRRILGLEQAR